MTAQFAQLVDTDRGMISRRIFIEPEIYAAELKQSVTAREPSVRF